MERCNTQSGGHIRMQVTAGRPSNIMLETPRQQRRKEDWQAPQRSLSPACLLATNDRKHSHGMQRDWHRSRLARPRAAAARTQIRPQGQHWTVSQCLRGSLAAGALEARGGRRAIRGHEGRAAEGGEQTKSRRGVRGAGFEASLMATAEIGRAHV